MVRYSVYLCSASSLLWLFFLLLSTKFIFPAENSMEWLYWKRNARTSLCARFPLGSSLGFKLLIAPQFNASVCSIPNFKLLSAQQFNASVYSIPNFKLFSVQQFNASVCSIPNFKLLTVQQFNASVICM